MNTLASYLANERLSPAEFAAKIGADRATVWRWVHDKNRPGFEMMLRIHAETGGKVDLNSWVPEIAPSRNGKGRAKRKGAAHG